jgi:hypothetical protein
LRTLSTSTHLRHSLISTISSRVRIRISKPSMVPVSTSGLRLVVATLAPSQLGSSLSTPVPQQPGLHLELSTQSKITPTTTTTCTCQLFAAVRPALISSATRPTTSSKLSLDSLDQKRSTTSTQSLVGEN